MASALLTALPKHSGHGGKEGHGHGGTSHGGTPVLAFFFAFEKKKKHCIQVVSMGVFGVTFFFCRVFHHICVFVSVSVYVYMISILHPLHIVGIHVFIPLIFSHFGDI